MRRAIPIVRVLTVLLIAAGVVCFDVARAQDRQAVPRDGSDTKTAQPRVAERERRPPPDAQRRAEPRDDRVGRDHDRGQPPRHPSSPGYHYFAPVDVRVRFHYHPYFGFYYGPYYGPWYPGPGAVAWVRFSEGALRLKVKPVATEVYVNGYYAGIVDDFDGVLQRLYLPKGEHDITLRLPGFASRTIPVRVHPGQTIDIQHEMRRLTAGRPDVPPPAPRPVPPEWSEPPDSVEAPVSPYGVLALRVHPPDARILVDGEAWGPIAGQSEFVIHLAAGWHEIDVRREGYETFTTRVDLIEGQTIRLAATLVRRQ